jgi:hypothetical protein
MTRLTHLRIVALCSAVLLLPSSGEAGHKCKRTGRVIAREAYIGLARPSSVTSVEIFILKVKDMRQAPSERRFAKVRYEDYGGRYPLPLDLLSGESSWRFVLRRDKTCDLLVSEGLFVVPSDSRELPKPGTFILVQSVNKEDVPPLGSSIPCFILRPGGAKRIGSASSPEGALL